MQTKNSPSALAYLLCIVLSVVDYSGMLRCASGWSCPAKGAVAMIGFLRFDQYKTGSPAAIRRHPSAGFWAHPR